MTRVAMTRGSVELAEARLVSLPVMSSLNERIKKVVYFNLLLKMMLDIEYIHDKTVGT
jgi:hypothetical protein